LSVHNTAEFKLADAVKLLCGLKSSLMHQRRFGSETLAGYRRACTNAEGDIEAWLIEHGFMKTND
jgi:hypothetical protein